MTNFSGSFRVCTHERHTWPVILANPTVEWVKKYVLFRMHWSLPLERTVRMRDVKVEQILKTLIISQKKTWRVENQVSLVI